MYKPNPPRPYNGVMATHKYHYHGAETVYLPDYGIEAEGGDATRVYETDRELHHPDFKEVFKPESKRKEAQTAK